MKNPNPDMLVRIAQGDAYGAAVEYLPSKHRHLLVKARRFYHYLAHPTHGHKPGAYTDDTQMSIAVAEVVLSTKLCLDRTVLRSDLANAFVCAFRRDRRTGYSRKFQAFLEDDSLAGTGSLLLANINPDSKKNGAAMRAVPFGVLKDPVWVMEAARANASITHDTIEGHISSVLIALMSHFALWTDEPFNGFADWVHQEDIWFDLNRHEREMVDRCVNVPWSGTVKHSDYCSVADATVHAVFTLLIHTRSLKESMMRAIDWGGDVDSVMAITWGIQSARLRDELPEWMDSGLENGPYGRDFLLDLGRKLMDKYR